jgi:hypothetical protein
MEFIINLIKNPNQELSQVANTLLGKPNQNLNNFKLNLVVDPCISLSEHQTPWIQVQMETRCNYGLTCQNLELPSP